MTASATDSSIDDPNHVRAQKIHAQLHVAHMLLDSAVTAEPALELRSYKQARQIYRAALEQIAELGRDDDECTAIDVGVASLHERLLEVRAWSRSS